MQHRRGSLLIIVAGLITLLASIAMAFLMRMRTDADDMSWLIRETQARIMLAAGCHYIQEASRLGLDDPATPAHEEGFGWVDVRDGKLGPKPVATGADDDSRFPIGSHARFPMYRMTRPPYAIQRQMVYNELRTPVSDRPIALATWDTFGVPWLINPDPQPVVDNGWNPSQTDVPLNAAAVNASNWPAFASGNRWPVAITAKKAWFRVYRQGPAEFVVTCGGGGTLGFRDWTEVLSVPGGSDEFAHDPGLFAAMQAIEVRLWYLVEWCAATAAPTRNNITSMLHDPLTNAYSGNGTGSNVTDSVRFTDHHVTSPINFRHQYLWSTADSKWDGPLGQPQVFLPNPVGTIRMIMRLRTPPSRW